MRKGCVIRTSTVVSGLLFAGLVGQAAAQGIFTCVDKQGRRLTSDRPIADCVDREQKQLNPSGTVKQKIGPNLTAAERAAAEERERLAAEEQARLAEEKRRDRVLLARYPNKEAHDRERADSLLQVDQVIAAARRRMVELGQQRKAIDTEFEFYKKDPSRAPAMLRRQIDDNEQSLAVQKRFIVDQESEKDRVNRRFDEELGKLRQLWAIQGAGVQPQGAASGKK